MNQHQFDRVFPGIIHDTMICSLIRYNRKREIIYNDHVGKASSRRGWISVLLVGALTNLPKQLRGKQKVCLKKKRAKRKSKTKSRT
jgi:hypothetical protein